MNHEARTDQLRRIAAAERRDPVDNAFLAFVALTTEQKLAFVAKYDEHARRRDYNRHVKLTATIHNPGVLK